MKFGVLKEANHGRMNGLWRDTANVGGENGVVELQQRCRWSRLILVAIQCTGPDAFFSQGIGHRVSIH
ncbi:hypothetical protein D3C81_2211570 [compost metagenome]